MDLRDEEMILVLFGLRDLKIQMMEKFVKVYELYIITYLSYRDVI